jgi:DNA-binding CsgD family transcriptional regulator
MESGGKEVSVLSSREKEILKLIAEEYTNAEIAEKLFLSVRTVDTHRQNLIQKLNVKNTAGLVKYAIKSGLA